MDTITVRGLFLVSSYQNTELLTKQFDAAGCELLLSHVKKQAEFSSILRDHSFEIILSDHNLPEIDAFQALQLRNEICPEVPFICVSQSISEESILDLLRQGATDFVLKDRPELLPFAVKRALDEVKHRQRESLSEKELLESEEKHRTLFETMPIGVIYQDASGTIISANPISERILGLTFDQMRGKTSMDSRWRMITEDGRDVPGSEHPAMLALKTGKRLGPVTRGVFIPEKEKYVWLSIKAIPLFRNGEKEPFQVYATFEDISRQKNAEDALLKSNRRLASFLEISQALNDTFDLNDVMQRVVYNAVRAMDLSTGAIYLCENGFLKIMAASPPLPENFLLNARLAKLNDHPLIKKAIESGEFFILQDSLTADLAPAEADILRKNNLRSCLYVPIKTRGKAIGVLILSSMGDVHEFHQEEILHIQGYANQAAQMIENTLSYQQIRTQATALEQEVFERKKTGQALKESNERLQKVLEAENVGVMFWDLDTGNLTDANDAFLTMMGYERADIATHSLSWQKFTPAEYHEITLGEIEKFNSVGRIGPYEKEYYCKDGSRKWLLFAGSSLGGNACVEFCVDITSRKLAEKSLVESESRYRSLFENMNAGFVLFEVIQDEQGNPVDLIIKAANEGFEKTTGLNLKNAIGRCLTKALPGIEKDDADWIGTYSRVALTGEATHFEQGSERLGFYYSISAFRAGPKQCAVTFVDITERKRTEEFNKESAERAKMQRNLIAQLTFEDSVVNSSIDNALKTLTTQLTTTLQVDRVSIWLLSDDDTELRCRMLYDTASGLHSQIDVLKVADNPSYFEALRKDSQVDADDARNDSRTKKLKDNYFIPLQISSLLDAAIQQDGRLIGILCVEHRGPIRKWHSDEKSFLSAISNLVAQLFANAERKQAEERLIESESRFRKIYEDGANGMVMAGKDFKFMMANRTFCQMTGYLEEELQQLTFSQITHPDDIAKDISNVKKMMAGEIDVYKTEKRYLKKSGQSFWAQLTVSPIYDSSRQFLYFVGIIVDSTERKQAELDLMRMSRIMENSQEIAHLGSFEYIAADQSTIWSEEEYRIYGLDPSGPSPFYKEMLEKCIHPEDRELLHNTFMQAIQNKGFYELEHRIIRPDGIVRWVFDKAHPYFDERGNLLGYIGATLDVTERKQSEMRLRKSEEKFRSLFINHTAAKLIIDPETGEILEANFAAAKFYGWPVEVLQKMNIRQINTLSSSLLDEEIRNVLQHKKNKFEFRHLISDGSMVDVEVFSSTIVLDGKKYLHSIIHDVSEKKKAERQLRVLNRAIEASSVAVIITNAKGKVFYVNPFFLHLTGYTSEEVRGSNLTLLKSGNQPETIYQELWQTISGGDTWEGELQNKKKNGDLFWVRTIISPIINSRGEVSDYVAIQEDITFKKQAEETNKKLEIAQKTARFKQDFLAKMSHEIRTPLTGVLGMIEVLEQTQLGEEQLDYVEDIKVSGENLKEIINQVLEYSKIEAGKVHLNPIAFEFKSLMDDAKILYKDSLNAGVEFVLEIDSRIPPFVKADKFRLSQVINNFVSNAIKFTQQGWISLKASLEENASEDEHMVIKIKVRDTGKGMPERLQKKLFNPFVQSEEGEREEYEGTGLGLSICKELVELMQGEIGVISEEEKGSTFWFSFTAETAEEILPSKTQKPSSLSTKKLRVLLVEDTLVLQKITKLLLNSMGHEVQLANHGQHALEIFEPGQFDLILMDVNMPIMDGVTALNILKETYINLPPIVGLSANAFEGDREKYLALGMDDYLTKPFNKNDFEKILPMILKEP